MKLINQIPSAREALLFAALIVVSYAAASWYLDQNYISAADSPVGPMNRHPVTSADLAGAGSCAKDILEARLRNGFDVTRSNLFYTEWSCDLAAKKRISS